MHISIDSILPRFGLGPEKPLQLVLLENSLHITLAANDDGALLVDAAWCDVQEPLDLAFEHAAGCHAARSLHDHGHGKTFVEHPELAIGLLLVGWVQVHPAIQNGSVHIR